MLWTRGTLANILGPAQSFHVGEGSADRHLDQRVGLASAVRDVFHEQKGEDVVLVKRGIHAAPELVAAFPEGPVNVDLLDGHGLPLLEISSVFSLIGRICPE